jgi:hypothetical protein
MSSQYARINAVKKVFSVLQADLEKSEILKNALGASGFSVSVSASDETEDSFDCRIDIQSSNGGVSEEDAEALSDWAETRFEEIAIEQLGQDEGEDLALELILVEVWLNGKELT